MRIFDKNIISGQVDKTTFDLFSKISCIAKKTDIPVYLVGGFVRDLILGKKNKDIDIAADGDSIYFAEAYKKTYGGNIVSFSKFKTVILLTENGEKIDVASSRSEFYPDPGSLPIVSDSDLINDMRRRDFTFNSLSVSLNPSDFGQLIDCMNGLHDLQKGIIRINHDKSFIDDPTRILRAVRFEQRFGFTFEKNTLKLLREAVKLNYLQTVSSERIREEIKKSCLEHRPEDFFQRLEDLGILQNIAEYLHFTPQMREDLIHIKDEISRYNSLFKSSELDLIVIYYLILLEPLNQENLTDFIRKYSLGNKIKRLGKLNISQKREKLREAGNDNFKIRQTLMKLNNEELIFLLNFFKNKNIKEKIRKYITEIRFIRLSINGQDLIKAGHKPGAETGKILDKMMNLKLNGYLKTEEEERKYILENL